MLEYVIGIVYFLLPMFMLAFRDYWSMNEYDPLFAMIPFFYSGVMCMFLHGECHCRVPQFLFGFMREILRWSIVVTMVYGWWNIYMFTVVHTIVWLWGVLKYINSNVRVTFI